MTLRDSKGAKVIFEYYYQPTRSVQVLWTIAKGYESGVYYDIENVDRMPTAKEGRE